MKLLLAIFICSYVTALRAGPIYQWRGQSVSESQLTPAAQQKIYEIDKKHYDEKKALIDDNLFRDHLKKLSDEQKVTVEDVEEGLLKTNPVSEKELRDFYNANQSVIPYSFETIQFELKTKLAQEKRTEKKQSIVSEIKKKNKFAWEIAAPVPPRFQIPLANDRPFMGNANSSVVLIEFGDYKCPYCAKAHGLIEKVMSQMKSKVKFVYLDFPSERSDLSFHLAKGGHCAHQEGKFWQYHQQIFKDQTKASFDFPLRFAKDHKLDMKKYEQCLNAEETKMHVINTREQGKALGVDMTPGLFLNGTKISLDDGSDGLIREMKKLL